MREPAWRTDFPVATGDERMVTRRQFSRFLLLTSLGMFVGNLWILVRSRFRRSAAYPELRVARVADVPVQGVKLFHYPGPDDPCLLIRTAEDTFVAYGQKCTHLSCAVLPKVAEGKLHCPCHEGWFAIDDGRVLQGPPPRPLPRVVLERRGEELFAVRIEGA
ncbi:MAG: Rieske (2Fe-2S) protein [Vicinamibacteria bacterium]|jgi:Rieske Fe-S protein|nr:Rieske (2Fe-2S) protein [Vicinamibacteria bacterium]